MTFSRLLSGLAVRLLWLTIAALVALGGAGIVTTINHVPGTPARAELTWTGDAEITPALDAATEELQGLADRVDAISQTARAALTQMVAGDTSTLQDTINAATTALAAVADQSASLAAALAAVPYTGADSALHV
ncbi:MAG: hypothetical protein WCK58_13695, partial [Chloroflexota bacterium]